MKKLSTPAVLLCICGALVLVLGYSRAHTLIWRYGMSSLLWGLLLFLAVLVSRYEPVSERIRGKRLIVSYLAVAYFLAVVVLLHFRWNKGLWYYTNPVEELFDFILFPLFLPFFGLAALVGTIYSTSPLEFVLRALIIPTFLALWYAVYRVSLLYRTRRAA